MSPLMLYWLEAVLRYDYVIKGKDEHVADHMVQDLRESVEALQRDPNCVKDGKAPVYGMANVNPDRSMVGEILVAVQDNLLD